MALQTWQSRRPGPRTAKPNPKHRVTFGIAGLTRQGGAQQTHGAGLQTAGFRREREVVEQVHWNLRIGVQQGTATQPIGGPGQVTMPSPVPIRTGDPSAH